MELPFAKFYVDAPVEQSTLMALIVGCTSGNVVGWTIESRLLEVDVLPNDEFDRKLASNLSGGFLYFPYTMDVEAADASVDLGAFVGAVGDLMESLAGEGAKIVVACDSEDQLPGSGRLGF